MNGAPRPRLGAQARGHSDCSRAPRAVAVPAWAASGSGGGDASGTAALEVRLSPKTVSAQQVQDRLLVAISGQLELRNRTRNSLSLTGMSAALDGIPPDHWQSGVSLPSALGARETLRVDYQSMYVLPAGATAANESLQVTHGQGISSGSTTVAIRPDAGARLDLTSTLAGAGAVLNADGTVTYTLNGTATVQNGTAFNLTLGAATQAVVVGGGAAATATGGTHALTVPVPLFGTSLRAQVNLPMVAAPDLTAAMEIPVAGIIENRELRAPDDSYRVAGTLALRNGNIYGMKVAQAQYTMTYVGKATGQERPLALSSYAANVQPS